MRIEDYKRAILIQDAVNLVAILTSFREVAARILRETKSTEAVNAHPIVVMYASKIASLTGCEVSPTFGSAYDECSELSKEES